jgi:methyl-accepting chemotaxis protein
MRARLAHWPYPRRPWPSRAGPWCRKWCRPGAINDSARKIVDIIGVIDSIAFQTNILALNAAVEAARAGEQGRGFAVVATEVRNLAHRSAAAAKEITALINDSVDKVGAGSKLVDQAGTTMREVVQSVQRVSDIIGEIALASEEQRSGIEQINQAITQMDQVTQQNAALVEQAAAAAGSLQEQSEHLAQAVGVFKVRGMPGADVRAAPARMVPLAHGAAPAIEVRPPARRLPAVAGAKSDWEEFSRRPARLGLGDGARQLVTGPMLNAGRRR